MLDNMLITSKTNEELKKKIGKYVETSPRACIENKPG